VHVKNVLIDKVIQLLVNLSFTKKEKEERSKEIQQQCSSSSRPKIEFSFQTTFKNPQGEEVIKQLLHLNTSVYGRVICAKMAKALLLDVSGKFPLDLNWQYIPDSLLGLHIQMYNRDWKHVSRIVDDIPESAFAATSF